MVGSSGDLLERGEVEDELDKAHTKVLIPTYLTGTAVVNRDYYVQARLGQFAGLALTTYLTHQDFSGEVALDQGISAIVSTRLVGT